MNDLETLITAVKGLVEFEGDLTEEALNDAISTVDDQFSTEITSQSINQIIKNLEDQELNKAEAIAAIKAVKEMFADLIYGEEKFEGNKKKLIDYIINKLYAVFDSAVEKYHSYSIELPMTVDVLSGAKVPTFAHDTDAAADLYAMEDQVIPAHSYGNKIGTGVKIQLPEGWLAMILPRSSMGTKTPLRLSNSVGLIDSGYRGELGILYDNTSDKDYAITAGDRIAQLLVMPSYRFKANVVDTLEDSDRGETGFGDSGK